ncbi:MAG: hypothetical protein LBO70_00240 [Clostridiales Family XIII bacterium]|jgi:hypothetical protein|nr:hypothetical protein [Clostridiales Family XIII bacterium]
MACFLVPTAEAIVTTVVAKCMKDAEVDPASVGDAVQAAKEDGRISWRTKLSWLNGLLWGGAVLLCLEHVWHGEVVFYPPFLTAMHSPADTAVMLKEMGTVGVGMALLVTAVWGVMILIVDRSPSLRTALAGRRG